MIDADRNRALCIHPFYDHRENPCAFDDRRMRDEWQDAVYRYARGIAVAEGCRRIIDVGCGSGFKLVKYFAGFDTVGFELEPALSFLRDLYPGRCWQSGDGLSSVALAGDLLICADVIEHLADPVAFMTMLADAPLQTIVLSTPALEILVERGQSPRLGPPDNVSHYNEWTTREFRDFCDIHLHVEDHLVVSAQQGTQLIVARPR